MKRLIYIVVACILFSIILHAQRIPRMLELYPNYFATAPTYDTDSFTLDKFYGDSVYKRHIVLRSPVIAKGDTLWTSFILLYRLDCTKQDFTPQVLFDAGYNELPKESVPLDSTQQEMAVKELRRIFSKDIMYKNTTFDEVYKIYEQYYQKLYMPDSTQSKQLEIAILYSLFLVPPAEKATETQTEAKQ